MSHTFDPFQTSPLRNRHAARWQLELDCSEWTLDVLESGRYLPPFSEKEHPDDLKYRRFMSAPLDMCRDGVRIRIDNLWRTAPIRSAKGSQYQSIIDLLIADADGDGTSLDAFMKGAATDMLVNGTDIVTQTTAAPDGVEVETQADAEEAGIRPFFARFSPLERLDWASKGNGGFLWARYSLGEAPALDEQVSSTGVTRFLTLTSEGWRIWESAPLSKTAGGGTKVRLVAEGTHPLGRPPIAKLYFGESRKPGQAGVPLSLLTRPAVVAKVLLNMKSQADADLLAAVTRWLLTGVGSDELPDSYGPGVVWKIPNPESKLMVVQGDVNHIIEKRAWVTLYIEEILRLLKFRGGMAEINASSGSGLKLAMERTDFENELRSTAEKLEATELEMMRQAVVLVTGTEIKPEDAADALGYKVHYNRDFTLEPLGEMLDNLKTWCDSCQFLSDDVPEITREMLRQVVNMLVRDDSPEHDKMMDEIDTATLEPDPAPETPPTPLATLTGVNDDQRDNQ